jgi:hypothetical protein
MTAQRSPRVQGRVHPVPHQLRPRRGDLLVDDLVIRAVLRLAERLGDSGAHLGWQLAEQPLLRIGEARSLRHSVGFIVEPLNGSSNLGLGKQRLEPREGVLGPLPAGR